MRGETPRPVPRLVIPVAGGPTHPTHLSYYVRYTEEQGSEDRGGSDQRALATSQLDRIPGPREARAGVRSRKPLPRRLQSLGGTTLSSPREGVLPQGGALGRGTAALTFLPGSP